MQRPIIALVVLGVLSASVWGAGPGELFRNVGIGGGGTMCYPVISPFDPDYMLIDSDMASQYRSVDGGKTWLIMHFVDIGNCSGRPVFDTRNTYMKAGATIKVSTDKGTTWAQTAGKYPWTDRLTLIQTVGEGRRSLLAATQTGLWLSADGGKTWTPSREGKSTAITHLGDTVFLAGDEHLYKSDDAGRSWQDITPGEARGREIVSVAAGREGGGMVLLALLGDKKTLLASTDWGETWDSRRVGGEDARLGSRLEMAANQTRIAFLSRSRELWRSLDSGKTWERCCYARNGLAPGLRDSEFLGRRKWGLGRVDFAVDPNDARRVMVVSMSDYFYSTDAGSTWKQGYNVEKGRLDPNSQDFFCVTRGLTMTSSWQYYFDPRQRNRRYIAYTDFGLLRSIDGGESWACSSPGNTTYAVQFDPDKPGRLYGAASSVHDIPGWGFVQDQPYRGGRVVVSDDYGDTWKTLGTGLPDVPCTYLELDRKRSESGKLVFWAAMYGDGLYRSDDSGATWQKMSGLGYPNNKHFYMVLVHPQTGDIYCSVSGIRRGSDFFQAGGLWHSSDDGRTWTDISKTLDLRWPAGFCLLPGKPGTVFLACSTAPQFKQGGVYKTTDDGEHWKRVLTDDDLSVLPNTSGLCHVRTVDVHPTKPNILYACTNSHGLWVSQNEGESWQFMKGVPHIRPTHVTVDPEDEETIYVTTFGAGTWVGHYLP